MSLAWPGSHCPHCGAPVKPYDNIPIASYLWLRGRCRSCRAPISIKYPLVELVDRRRVPGRVSAVRFAGALIQRLLFACAMIVLFVIDLEHRILPDVITLPGIVLGFVFSLFMPPGWRRFAHRHRRRRRIAVADGRDLLPYPPRRRHGIRRREDARDDRRLPRLEADAADAGPLVVPRLDRRRRA